MTTTRLPVDELAGRALAMCCHPVAAWKVVSPGERGLIVSIYISAGYILSLAGLLYLR